MNVDDLRVGLACVKSCEQWLFRLGDLGLNRHIELFLLVLQSKFLIKRKILVE